MNFCRLHTSDIEDFIRENCAKATDEPHTFKITFVVNGEKGKSCAVEEPDGCFNCYTHTTSSRTDELKLDISRPGG